MNVACSSATFAIEQAVNAVRTGSAKCVLVVNPEITSGHHEWRDRDCHFIFGDVCTAVIVERADCATSADQWEVLGTKLATQFSNSIRNNFGFLNRCEDSDPNARDKTFRQEAAKCSRKWCRWLPPTSRPIWPRWSRHRRPCAAIGCTRPIME
jgi:3-oxoacyl-[acyl-carrier-protein] synthase III